MKDIIIAGAVRTPVRSFNGALSNASCRQFKALLFRFMTGKIEVKIEIKKKGVIK